MGLDVVEPSLARIVVDSEDPRVDLDEAGNLAIRSLRVVVSDADARGSVTAA
jgi:hypothetical protein